MSDVKIGDTVEIKCTTSKSRGHMGTLQKIQYSRGLPIFALVKINRLGRKGPTEASIRSRPGELKVTKV